MARTKSPPGPDHLTMRLFAPGMSLLHRAGLGGLACTLMAMKSQADRLRQEDKLPSQFRDGTPPWDITADSVTLNFGKPENASEYLKKLFAFAFQIRDGLIYLPGQYETVPSTAILADLQSGVILTFLQHGRVRQLAAEQTPVSYDPEGEGVPGVVVQFRRCSYFKHQCGWEDFVEPNGCLATGAIRVDGPVSPGSVVRHVAFTTDTAAEDPPERMLPLLFALVGCLALPVNRGVAALLVPEVENLNEFILDRPAMTPTTATTCQIANAADAALQTQVRLRAREEMGGRAILGVYAMTFTPTAWASQQKSRVATIHVPRGEDRTLGRFCRAMAWLPSRVVTRTIQEGTGRGRQRVVRERRESFRTASIVRPLVAENLALGRKWYAGFVNLMTKTNPANGELYRNQLLFEREGLNAMTADRLMWDDEGEALVVKAVHEAIRYTLGRIREETDGTDDLPPTQATKNRWTKFRDTLRISLSGAKTANDARHALCNLFSRAGRVPALIAGWQVILPKLADNRWQLTRDLALLALASYGGRGDTNSGDKQP